MSIISTMLSLKSAEEQEWKELYTYIVMLEHREKELKWFNDILENQNLDKAKEIKKLKNQLQQKENIIKEVREYIYENSFDEERKEIIDELWVNEIKDILEILEKEKK